MSEGSEGGGTSYVLDKGQSRSTTGFENDALIARIQAQYLTDRSNRVKNIFDLENQINAQDYGSLALQNQQKMEIQNRAQAATRGGEAAALTTPSLLLANAATQDSYAKQIQDLINAPFTYQYAPKITGEGLKSYSDYQTELKGYEDTLNGLNAQLAAAQAIVAGPAYYPNGERIDKTAAQAQIKALTPQIQSVTNQRNAVDTGDMNAQKQFEDSQAAKKSQIDDYIANDKSGFQAVYGDYEKSLKQRQADRLKPSEDVVKGYAQAAGQEASGNFIPDLPDPNAKLKAAAKAGVPTSPLTPKKPVSNSIIQSNMVGSNEGFLGQSNSL
jgi:hypothetical protein